VPRCTTGVDTAGQMTDEQTNTAAAAIVMHHVGGGCKGKGGEGAVRSGRRDQLVPRTGQCTAPTTHSVHRICQHPQYQLNE